METACATWSCLAAMLHTDFAVFLVLESLNRRFDQNDDGSLDLFLFLPSFNSLRENS